MRETSATASTERFWLPDAFITTNFMMHRMNNVIANLTVMPKNMMKNLNLTGGLVFSQRVLTRTSSSRCK